MEAAEGVHQKRRAGCTRRAAAKQKVAGSRKPQSEAVKTLKKEGAGWALRLQGKPCQGTLLKALPIFLFGKVFYF